MNDYWDYLAHSQGEERAGHKYYARIPVGKNKLGFTQYRYFYDAREYGAYKTRKQKESNTADKNFGKQKTAVKKSNRTTFYTGWNNDGKLPSKQERSDIQSNGGEAYKLKKGQSTLDSKVPYSQFELSMHNMLTDKKTVYKSKMAKVSAKTVTHKKSLKERGKSVIARLLKRQKG